MTRIPPNTDIKQYKLIIQGNVQGVYFRQSSLEIAKQLKLYGWVKNNTDKTITIVMKGPKIACKKMIIWCRKGPPKATVTTIKITETPSAYTKKTFTIK